MTDLKANYKGKYDNTSCRRCGSHEENIEHIWQCKKFKRELPDIKNIFKNNAKELIKIENLIELFQS